MPLFIRRALTHQTQVAIVGSLGHLERIWGFLSVGHAEPNPAFTAGIAAAGTTLTPDMPIFESCHCDGYGSLFDAGHEFDEHGFPFFTA